MIISSGEGGEWQLSEYLLKTRGAIKEWRDAELSFGAQLQFDALLKSLRFAGEPNTWPKYRGHLKGLPAKHKVFEFGFHADKRQYRILCVTRVGREIVMLLGCYHKEDVYKPVKSLTTASDRAKEIHEGFAKTRKYTLDLSV